MKHTLTILLLGTFFSVIGYAQKRISREEYIAMYKDNAIKNMRDHKVPASITLAQALLESDNGNSELSRKYNNHFGIKCHSSWTGKKTYHDDDKKKECFRVYKTVYDSYADHSNFLHKDRYARCFELDIEDYKRWANELKKAGYATNPKYPQLLIKIIEDNKLYLYDREALKGTAAVAANAGKPKSKNKKNGKSDDEQFDELDYYGKPMVKKSDNNIKFITAKKGDTPKTIATLMEMGDWQITKYNNVSKSYVFSEGETVYLQPKKSKAKKATHIVAKGESMWDISQRYGVKLKALYKYNEMSKGSEPKTGQVIRLKK